MSSTFDTVANIIAETCDIPREKIKPESHAIDDLGIDSLDFLDIAFAIDKAFGIKLPLEQWTQEVNDGKATTEQYFVLKNLCARIDDLVAAKGSREQRWQDGMRLEYFQMIDRIVGIDLADRTIRTEARVPLASTIFEGHFPGHPLMPGVLLIEAMAQTAGWLVIAVTQFTRMPFLAAVKEAKLRTFVTPGQLLALTAELVHDGSGYAMTRAQVAARRQGRSATPTSRSASWIFPAGSSATACRIGRSASSFRPERWRMADISREVVITGIGIRLVPRRGAAGALAGPVGRATDGR